MSRIVVGFDGSDSALKTVAWALAEAEVHHWALHVVTVLEQHPVPSTWGAPAYVPVTETELDALRANAQRAVDDLIAAGHRPSTVPVSITVASGQPAAVLIRESETAEHLVVGCRGIGGFGRLLLGSVSNQVVHHAVCPVTIIHHERRPGSPDVESSHGPQPDAQNGN